MEGGAPPEGGLESPVNTTLPPESGGVGTQPNTLNDTPGNTTHGTLHEPAGNPEASMAMLEEDGDTRFACAAGRAFCMNGSFNIRTRQDGSGRVGHGARTDATM
jgi:hypothetical protein